MCPGVVASVNKTHPNILRMRVCYAWVIHDVLCTLCATTCTMAGPGLDSDTEYVSAAGLSEVLTPSATVADSQLEDPG